MALEVIADPGPTMVRAVAAAGGSLVRQAPQPPGNSGAATLSALLAWGTQRLPARHYALLVMGHGTGLLRGAELPPGAIDTHALAAGLRSWGAEKRPLDLVGLDTCYGGTIEIAYALRGLCRYVTAAPGVIYSPGLDWAGALATAGPESGGEELAGELVRRGMPEHPAPVALVALDLGQLEPAAVAVAELAAAVRPGGATPPAALTYARAHCGSWGERQELADLRPLVAVLADEAPAAEVRQAAAQAKTALARLVVETWQEPPPQSGAAGGLGVYFPPTLETLPGGYARLWEFASVCHWADLLDTYWGCLFQVLTGQP